MAGIVNALITAVTVVALNPLIWIWLVLAILGWRMSASRRRARIVLALLLVAIWAIGTRPVADLVLWPLESQYSSPSVQSLRDAGVRQVLVLTGGGYPLDGDLLTSGLPFASEIRFLSGLELCDQLGNGCRIVFSGSAGRTHETRGTADVMAALARRLRPDQEVVSESKSVDTAEHPVNAGPLLKRERFALVTSAYHMPRAMLVFTRAGYRPDPFPVDRLVRWDYDWTSLFPSPEGLSTIQLALHEYVGLVWYSLTIHY